MTQCLANFPEHPFLTIQACSDCDNGHTNGEPDTYEAKQKRQYDQKVIYEGGKHDTVPFFVKNTCLQSYN